MNSVDKNVVGWGNELFYGILHSEQRGLKDIHLVDDFVARATDRYRDRSALNLVKQAITLLWRQLL